jgi:hypothetical protein
MTSSASMDATEGGKQRDLKQNNNMLHGIILFEHHLRLVFLDFSSCVLNLVQLESSLEARGMCKQKKSAYWK